MVLRGPVISMSDPVRRAKRRVSAPDGTEVEITVELYADGSQTIKIDLHAPARPGGITMQQISDEYVTPLVKLAVESLKKE
jgi:hypothetical protein